MVEEDYAFSCPHCGVDLSVRLEPGAGRKQELIQDCEVCCRPIRIFAEFRGEELISFSAEPDE